MIFAFTLLLPLLALAVWAFWHLSPRPADPQPVLWFNWTVTVLSLVVCVALVMLETAGPVDTNPPDAA